MYTAPYTYVVRTADNVLIREVSIIQSVLNREVPLYMVRNIGRERFDLADIKPPNLKPTVKISHYIGIGHWCVNYTCTVV